MRCPIRSPISDEELEAMLETAPHGWLYHGGQEAYEAGQPSSINAARPPGIGHTLDDFRVVLFLGAWRSAGIRGMEV